ncbi:MAG: transcriptional regulator GcvA [Halofilum sp. (in: g-proteobacteria)]|nr:transcriptional regulator GcvA [Halofilum sp. (in: g-proteobacteria)]
MRRVPPLNGLRVFEAAARFESFNRAAEALHVTPSAVSHQIKALERYLGVDLFQRTPRSVTLTRAGRTYLPPIRDALEQIGIATEQIHQLETRSILTVSTTPSFAVGWLLPRLAEFQLEQPHLEVRLDTSIEFTDFDTSDVDVCIRYTAQRAFPELRAYRVLQEELIPVCSPEFARRHRLRRPEDLRGVPLLHNYPHMGQWRSWLSAAGVEGIDAEAGQKFANDAIAVEAAASGLGVAVADRLLLERQLKEGRVVAPFEFGAGGDYAYHLLYPPEYERDPRITTFRDWVLRLANPDGAAPATDDAGDAGPGGEPAPSVTGNAAGRAAAD